MRLIVLGATGATGEHIVDQALAAGHEVTAYVRTPAKIVRKDHRLRVVQGSIADAAGLRAALRGQDAVLSALGHTRLFEKTPYVANAVRLVLEGMRAEGVRRFVYESAYRAGENPGDLGFVFEKILRPLLLNNAFNDHTEAEAAISASAVEWIIARPGILTNGPLTGTYRAQERFARGEAVRISRADTAHFMVRQMGETPWLRKMVGLAY